MHPRFEEVKALLDAAVKDTGAQLKLTTAELATYTIMRSAVAASSFGMPGHDLAVAAELDNVRLRLGIASVKSADAADQRILGIVHALLAIGLG